MESIDTYLAGTEDVHAWERLTDRMESVQQRHSLSIVPWEALEEMLERADIEMKAADEEGDMKLLDEIMRHRDDVFDEMRERQKKPWPAMVLKDRKWSYELLTATKITYYALKKIVVEMGERSPGNVFIGAALDNMQLRMLNSRSWMRKILENEQEVQRKDRFVEAECMTNVDACMRRIEKLLHEWIEESYGGKSHWES